MKKCGGIFVTKKPPKQIKVDFTFDSRGGENGGENPF